MFLGVNTPGFLTTPKLLHKANNYPSVDINIRYNLGHFTELKRSNDHVIFIFDPISSTCRFCSNFQWKLKMKEKIAKSKRTA